MTRLILAVYSLLVVLLGSAVEVHYLDDVSAELHTAVVQHCTHMCFNNAALLDPSTITDLR